MRKVFWGCAILAVALAVHAWVAALYVYKYPDSLLGRCVRTGYMVSTQCNPLCKVGHAIGTHALTMARTALDEAVAVEQKAVATAEEVLVPAEPQPVAVCQPQAAVCAAEPCEPAIDLNQGRLPGKIVIEEEALQPIPPLPVEDEPMPGVGQAGFQIADAQPMPRCPDDDVALVPMPKAKCGDDPEDNDNFWTKVFGKSEKKCEGGTEECEPKSATNPPECKEDPTLHYQCPGCPHLGHSCPNVCPYTGKCYSDIPEPELIGKPTPIKIKKKAKRAMPKSLAEPELIPAPHTDIDTMEFRPSDFGACERRLPPV